MQVSHGAATVIIIIIIIAGASYIIFDITCSNDTHVGAQDFSALQHHLFQLRKQEINNQNIMLLNLT